MRVLWAGLLVIWTVPFLWLATAFGVASFYVVAAEPLEPHSWLVASVWLAAAVAGALVLVFLAKRAFDRPSNERINAQNH